MIILWSSYDHPMIILWSYYDHIMIILWSSYHHLTIILPSSYNHLKIILWSSYKHLMIILWSSYDHLMIILWSSYDHLTIILQWSYNHLTIILWSSYNHITIQIIKKLAFNIKPSLKCYDEALYLKNDLKNFLSRLVNIQPVYDCNIWNGSQFNFSWKNTLATTPKMQISEKYIFLLLKKRAKPKCTVTSSCRIFLVGLLTNNWLLVYVRLGEVRSG